jgi:hypothetical protein
MACKTGRQRQAVDSRKFSSRKYMGHEKVGMGETGKDECQGLGQVSNSGCGVASLDCGVVMK